MKKSANVSGICLLSAVACMMIGWQDVAGQAALELVSGGYVSPSNLVSWPGTTKDLVIADQVGVLYYLKNGDPRSRMVVGDFRSRMVKLNEGFDERGLLGIAFHPRFSENKYLYVYYSAPKRESAPAEYDHTSHISRFVVNGDDGVDLDSEKVILQVDEPQSNHNSGRMAFGPDGYLYISMGDGGAGNDTGLGHGENGNGQNTQTLLGKVLRIDVDQGDPYSIPSDNPFANGGGLPEIYAWGLRNPWGLSFDRGGDHRLFLADVGQSRWEEVNIIVNGGNYGWRVREGMTGFDPKQPRVTQDLEAPVVDGSGNRFIDPIIMYKNKGAFNRDEEAQGISITGGYVYRGQTFPEWDGAYIFGDWSTGWASSSGVLFIAREKAGHWSMETLSSPHIPKGAVAGYVVAFGQTDDGEIYVMTNSSNGLIGTNGKVYKIVSKPIKVSQVD